MLWLLFEQYPQCILAASSSRPDLIPTRHWHHMCTCLRGAEHITSYWYACAGSRGRLTTSGAAKRWKCAGYVWSLVTWNWFSLNITQRVFVLLTRAFQIVVAGTALKLNLIAKRSAYLIGFKLKDILAGNWIEVTGQNCRGKYSISTMKWSTEIIYR